MNLQNMAASTKRSMLVTFIFFAVAAGIYLVGIDATEAQLNKVKAELQQSNDRHHTMSVDLSRADRVQADLDKGEKELAAYEAQLIKPLLESTAMRAKSLVDSIATGCGLTGMEYEALPAMDIPVVSGPVPQQRHVRCPIQMTCVGSYQAAISFVRCIERQFPLVALEAIKIVSQNSPDYQQVTIILEWPMKKRGVPTK